MVENALRIKFIRENKMETGVVFTLACDPRYTPSNPPDSARIGDILIGRMKCNNTNHWSNKPECIGMTVANIMTFKKMILP